MKGHPTEHLIESILLAPADVESGLRREIEDHVERCSLCSETALLLKNFHTQLRHSSQASPEVEEFLRRISPAPLTVDLQPYRFVPDATEFGEHAMSVLAAKSEAAKEYRYTPVCTLLSRNEETLVRILKDCQTDTYRVYVITKTRKSLNATLRFPSLDLVVSVNPETQQGQFSLPARQPGIDWTNIVAELRFS